jgi:hypothetical protein
MRVTSDPRSKQNADQPRRGGWYRATYRALPVPGVPGHYTCRAKDQGANMWTAAELQAWAAEIGANVVLTAWDRGSVAGNG